MSFAVFCDFDGTITKKDTGRELLINFGKGDWEKYNELVIEGKIGTREALITQWGMFQANKEQMWSVINKIEIDPSFIEFYKWLIQQSNSSFSIVSDGFKSYICDILKNNGISPEKIDIKANDMEIVNKKIVLKFLTPPCEHGCANCKYSHVLEKKKMGLYIIYIGDGLSDLLPAQLADLIFAKENKTLAKKLKNDKRLITFNNFYEVKEELEKRLNSFMIAP